MSNYVLYLDDLLIQLFANFAFTCLLLWATKEVTKTKTRKVRLVLGGLFGTTHYLLFLLAQSSLIPYYGVLRFFPVVFGVSFLMILLAFGRLTLPKLLQVLGYFHGIGFLSAGAGIAAAYLFGSPYHPNTTLGMLIAMASILVIAELGWGVLQKRIAHYVYQVPIQISLDQRTVNLNALVDTGNRLKDPLTQKNVIVVEMAALTPLFPPDCISLLKRDLTTMDSLLENEHLARRIRVLPFSSLGTKHGLLLGFRPDRVLLYPGETIECTGHVIVGIHPQELDPNGEYQGLIPPELLNRPPTQRRL